MNGNLKAWATAGGIIAAMAIGGTSAVISGNAQDTVQQNRQDIIRLETQYQHIYESLQEIKQILRERK